MELDDVHMISSLQFLKGVRLLQEQHLADDAWRLVEAPLVGPPGGGGRGVARECCLAACRRWWRPAGGAGLAQCMHMLLWHCRLPRVE